MIERFVGYVFRAVGRLRGAPAGDDLARVGEELLRLARAPPHPPTSSR